MRQIFIVLLVFLSACAPAQLGGSVFSPFEEDKGMVSISGPGVWFVKSESMKFNVPLSIRNRAFADAKFGYDEIQLGAKKSATVEWLKLESPVTPANWTLELARQEVTRSIVDVDEDRSYSFQDRLSVTFKLTISNGTLPGPYNVAMNLRLVDSKTVSSKQLRVILTSAATIQR